MQRVMEAFETRRIDPQLYLRYSVKCLREFHLGLKKEAGARGFCHWHRVIIRLTRMALSVAENLKSVASGV